MTCRCGETYTGAQWHRRAGEKPCAESLAAESEYMRDWRSRSPAAYMRGKERDAARDRALRVLGRRHRAELFRLTQIELEKVRKGKR